MLELFLTKAIEAVGVTSGILIGTIVILTILSLLGFILKKIFKS